jgi:hypothetical protein
LPPAQRSRGLLIDAFIGEGLGQLVVEPGCGRISACVDERKDEFGVSGTGHRHPIAHLAGSFGSIIGALPHSPAIFCERTGRFTGVYGAFAAFALWADNDLPVRDRTGHNAV